MVYKKKIQETILAKKKELAEIQSMIDLVKYYIQLKEKEEQREPRPFKFIINLDEDDQSVGPSISLTQMFPSAKMPAIKSWGDMDEEDGRFFETYRPVFH